MRRSSPVTRLTVGLSVMTATVGCAAVAPRTAQGQRARSCAEIQAAIDRLPRAGGTVRLRRETYICRFSVVIDRDHVTLLGRGSATVLKLAPHRNRPVLILGQTLPQPFTFRSHIRVADLSIDGTRLQQEHECQGPVCAGGDVLRNNGVSLRHVSDVVIEHVAIRHARSAGIGTEQGARRVTLRDVEVADSQFDGIAGFATRDSVFTNLRLHDNLKAGLSFDGAFDHNTISDAVLTDNRDVGLYMREAFDNTFSRMQISDSGSYGLYLAQNGSAAKPAAGNAFRQMIVARSGRNPTLGGDGMRVNDDSCVGNSLTNVRFVDNRGGGISEPTAGLVKVTGVTTK